ncbi:MAG: hypothetical protein AAFQ94_26335 [Bacteroidota bacterium]
MNENQKEVMTDAEKEELIEFGKGLMAKGNLPSTIRDVFKSRVRDRQLRDEILAQVFKVNITKKVDHRTDAQKAEDLAMMKARHIFSDFSDQNKKSFQLGIFTILLTVVALLFGIPFAIMTFLQGLIVTMIYAVIRKKKAYHLVRGIVLAFLGLMVAEILLFGIPDPLFAWGKDVLSERRTGLFKIFNQVTPFIYLGYKLVVAILLTFNLSLKVKFDKLPEDVRYKIDPL